MCSASFLFACITQEAWRDLLYSLRTGEPAFHHVFGMDSFSYMAQHPEEAANFDEAITDFTKGIAIAVAATYDFSQFGTIVDVRSGNGIFLEAVLKAHPTLREVLFDMPHVADRAQQRIEAIGVGERCKAVDGDFFLEVPSGGDAYILKHVIHDWDDARAVTILRNCHRAMDPQGKLLIVEGIYPSRIDQSDASRGAASNDVNMLV